MEFITFRFERDGDAEQWIVPMREVLEFINVTKWEILIPVAVLHENPRVAHTIIINVLFVGQKTPIREVASKHRDTYFLFDAKLPTITALDALVEQWSGAGIARKVQYQKPRSLHRL